MRSHFRAADIWLQSMQKSGHDFLSVRKHLKEGNLEKLREDISKNPSLLHSLGPQKETLLHNASHTGHLEIVKYL